MDSVAVGSEGALPARRAEGFIGAMGSVWAWTLGSVAVVGLVSLLGMAALYLAVKDLQPLLFVLISLAVGGLFGDAFIHLLPEIYRRRPDTVWTPLGVLAGILLFFALEKALRAHSHHRAGAEIAPVGPMNLVADSAHNLVDGALIAASFMANRELGIATSVAVLLHEIPHEIGDYAVLVHAGYAPGKAVVFNFLTALLSLAGALVTLALGQAVADFTRLVLPIATGGFIYVAGADLLPELQKETRLQTTLAQLAAMSVGIGLMLLLLLLE
jgi:zinc and cadmium transporter